MERIHLNQGFSINTKLMECNVLDYYASLWHAKWPHNESHMESYRVHLLSMGSTERKFMIFGVYMPIPLET